MVDTVRSATELLNSLFAQGQVPGSITEQDVRDMIVSISLETTDLSSLPRSPAGLPLGRLWIDNTTALRVVTTVQPANVVDFMAFTGRGSWFAQGVKPGAQLWPDSALFSGAGSLLANPSVRQTGSAFAYPAGVGSLLATPILIDSVTQQTNGSGLFIPTARTRLLGKRTFGGVGGWVATAQAAGSMVWAAGTNVVRENSNLRWRSAYPEGTTSWVSTTGTSFKSSGKWYAEMFFPPRTDEQRYGIANPSFNPADGIGNDANSWGVFDNYDGTGTDVYNGSTTYSGTIAPNTEGSIVSVALDCDNWKWWSRVDGGAWSTLAGGTQNPATNQGGAAIPTGLRTGGVSVASSNLFGTGDYIDLFPTLSSWTYTAPSGFNAM